MPEAASFFFQVFSRRLFLASAIKIAAPYLGTAFDKLPAVDIVMAVDVTGGPEPKKRRPQPTIVDMIFGSRQITLKMLINERLKVSTPDIFLRPNLNTVRVLDFGRARSILKTIGPLKEEAKRQLEAAIVRGQN